MPPPKFKAPLPKEKMTVAEEPPETSTLLETFTTVERIAPPSKTLKIEPAPAAPAVTEPALNKVTNDAVVPEPPAVSTTPPSDKLVELETKLKKEIGKDTTGIKLPVVIPSTRRAFAKFMYQTFRNYYLDERPKEFDPKACEAIKSASKGEQKAFKYQQLIRDYMQRASPFRGVLVNHGLGSGKSCSSIAAMEALLSTGPVIIMTPASLRQNYITEIQKCGPFLFRTNNYWEFIAVPSMKEVSPELAFLLNVMKMSRTLIQRRKGAWVPIPEKPSNFDTLPGSDKDQIRLQIEEYIQERFQFVNYNGLRGETVRDWACNHPYMFDGATIIIDEIHNLIRMINNSDLKTYYTSAKKSEPHTTPNYTPAFCKVPRKYSPSYLLYRMLCNAVGAKIIGLSATPIINFPQEVAILANVLGGDIRMIKATVSLSEKEKILAALQAHPELDFVEVEARQEGGVATVLMTPLPSGFRKIVEGGEMKGMTRDESLAGSSLEIQRERDLPALFERIKATVPTLQSPTYSCTTRLPDLPEDFNQRFIDPIKLEVKASARNVLMSRLSGLISYYKGEDPNMMAKANPDTIFELDMSAVQLQRYSEVRREEIKKESKQFSSGMKGGSEMFSLLTSKVSATFKIFSRAACNFAFPMDMIRPRPSVESKSSDEEEGDEEEVEKEEEEEEEVEPVEPELSDPSKRKAIKEKYKQDIQTALTTFQTNKEKYFAKGELEKFSPKYQKMLDTILSSSGSALVYSQFKSLEGLTLFTMGLEQQQNYGAMDIESEGEGNWRLKESTKAGGKRPRYIQYTGGITKEKRNILKAIFNGKWSDMPSTLAKEVQDLCGQDHNRDGMIVKVFMITQSGAEGISLSNVRQVHIMEPYWNKVRTDQVKGRAIRICSHSDLPPEQRVVDTFFYVMKFSKEQLEKGLVNQTFKIKDKALSTDQMILQIAESKEHLNGSILSAMKSSAIDCELNKKQNGLTEACYWFSLDKDHPATMTNSMKYIFHPLIDTDMSIQASSVKTIT
jgi:hypothetical protein